MNLSQTPVFRVRWPSQPETLVFVTCESLLSNHFSPDSILPQRLCKARKLVCLTVLTVVSFISYPVSFEQIQTETRGLCLHMKNYKVIYSLTHTYYISEETIYNMQIYVCQIYFNKNKNLFCYSTEMVPISLWCHHPITRTIL